MEYPIIVVFWAKSIGTDFSKACQELAEKVNEQARWGWNPQGGLAIGETQSLEQPYILRGTAKN